MMSKQWFKRSVILATMLAIGLIFAGCSDVLKLIQSASVQKPKVHVQSVKLSGLNFDGADLNVNVAIENPNAIAVDLAGFDYDLLINKQSFLKGKQTRKTKIEANGHSVVQLPVRLDFKKLYRTFQSLKQSDSVRYTLKTGFSFQLPVLGTVRVPAQTSGRIPTLKMPQLSVKSLKLENLGFTTAKLRLILDLKNPNAWSAVLNKMDYRFVVNGSQWVAGELQQTQKLDAKQESTLEIPIELNFLQMGRTVYNLLTHPGALNYELDGMADLKSSIKLLGDFKLPIKQSGKIELVK